MSEIKKTWDTLTAPGSTIGFGCKGFMNHSFQVTIANIDTTVVVRAKGSIDEGASYQNLQVSNLNTTYTANGTFGMKLSGVPLDFVQFEFVSETGGTAVTLAPTYKGGN